MTKLSLLAILLVASVAVAQTGPRCGQATNLACASGTPSTQDVATLYNFKGSNTIFTADGVTADANKISFVLTADPAASFTVSIPAGAASATMQGITCAGGQHISALSATTGLPTCSADTGGTPAWDTITNPTTSNLSLSMAAHLTTFTWNATTGAAANMFSLLDTASNTGTGYVLSVNTASSSAAKPVRFTAGGTANGVDMTTAGLLEAIGSGAIQATDVKAGGLANTLVWNELCTASPCTLAGTPRTADTALVFWRTLKLRRVAACGGINEYTLSGATLTLCDSTGIGSGADSLQVAYEK